MIKCINDYYHYLFLSFASKEESKMKIQSVLFKRRYWSTRKARKWLKKHRLKRIKRVHRTKSYYRYRIREPKFDKYTTKSIKKSVKLVLGVD